jgi:hypothetical protein
MFKHGIYTIATWETEGFESLVHKISLMIQVLILILCRVVLNRVWSSLLDVGSQSHLEVEVHRAQQIRRGHCTTKDKLLFNKYQDFPLKSDDLRFSRMKHLDPDYEVDRPPMGLVPHFWDTINVLGGWRGMVLISIGVIIFYFVVDYAVMQGRKNRMIKKKA